MNEIEKMYENAGVEPDRVVCYRGFDRCIDNDDNCHCHSKKPCKDATPIYPDFTAEKQIAIIKLISKQGQVIIENWENDNKGFNVTFRANSNLRSITMESVTRQTVEETLAQIVNDIWQDLTEEEQQQIKEILE